MRENLSYPSKHGISTHEKNSHCILYIAALRLCDVKSNESEMRLHKSDRSDLYVQPDIDQ